MLPRHPVIKLIERNPECLGNADEGRLTRPGIRTFHIRAGRLPHLKARRHFRLGDTKALPPRTDQAPSILDLNADHFMRHRLPRRDARLIASQRDVFVVGKHNEGRPSPVSMMVWFVLTVFSARLLPGWGFSPSGHRTASPLALRPFGFRDARRTAHLCRVTQQVARRAHAPEIDGSSQSLDLSPLTRGTLPDETSITFEIRFIPAYAGNTPNISDCFKKKKSAP